MSELSPAALVVVRAMAGRIQLLGEIAPSRQIAAAALRAAADQVVPVTSQPNDEFCCPPVATIIWNRVTEIRKQLIAIAAELEGHV